MSADSRRLVGALCATLLMGLGCVSWTGKDVALVGGREYEPLPEDAPVEVYAGVPGWGLPVAESFSDATYVAVGRATRQTVTIFGDSSRPTNLDTATRIATKLARQKGGNVVVVHGAHDAMTFDILRRESTLPPQE